jgi:hypothetical protein
VSTATDCDTVIGSALGLQSPSLQISRKVTSDYKHIQRENARSPLVPASSFKVVKSPLEISTPIKCVSDKGKIHVGEKQQNQSRIVTPNSLRKSGETITLNKSASESRYVSSMLPNSTQKRRASRPVYLDARQPFHWIPTTAVNEESRNEGRNQSNLHDVSILSLSSGQELLINGIDAKPSAVNDNSVSKKIKKTSSKVKKSVLSHKNNTDKSAAVSEAFVGKANDDSKIVRIRSSSAPAQKSRANRL